MSQNMNGHAPSSGDNKNPAQDPRFKKSQGRRKYIMLGLLFLAFVLFSGAKYKHKEVLNYWLGAPVYTVHHANLWVVVPQQGDREGVDVDLCRTVVSAATQGYPNPVTIPYNSGPSRAEGIVKFLEGGISDDDMIIVAENAYFQMPSEVLLQRYYDIIGDTHKKDGQHWQSVLMAATSGEPNQHMVMGPAWALHAAYSYSQEHSIELDAAYREQQKAHSNQRRSLFSRQDTASEAPEKTKDSRPPASAAELGITLDPLDYLLASFPALHRIKAVKDADFVRSQPPFWTVLGFESTRLPNSTWFEVEVLGTDDAKHIVPALIQFNPDASAADRRSAWSSLWYHPHARSLFTYAMLRPNIALASVLDKSGEETVERRFWNADMPAHGWRSFGSRPYTTDELTSFVWLCGGAGPSEDIFGDGKGDWKSPDL